jgi:hypothetical protein
VFNGLNSEMQLKASPYGANVAALEELDAQKLLRCHSEAQDYSRAKKQGAK